MESMLADFVAISPDNRMIASDDVVDPHIDRFFEIFDSRGYDVSSRRTFAFVFRWFIRYALSQRHPYRFRPPDRGIFLFGPTGCGKTFLFSEANRMIGKYAIPTFRTLDLIGEYRRYGQESIDADIRRFSGKTIYIDDIGAEGDAVSYGNRFNMEAYLSWRYDCYVNSGSLTVISSNIMNADEIKKRYGVRVFSRICEMCDIAFYDHADRRMRNVKVY